MVLVNEAEYQALLGVLGDKQVIRVLPAQLVSSNLAVPGDGQVVVNFDSGAGAAAGRSITSVAEPENVAAAGKL